MKANELRIGNLVYFEDEILKFEFESGWNFDFIKPIPLTDEWLFKCGFKKNQRDIRFKRLRSVVLKSTEKGFKFNYGESITYIHFVHQLQNLHFALNGNELTIIEKL